MIEITEKDLVDVPLDPVNHPSHYETGKYECIGVMLETQGEEAVKGFCICNAMKYLYRHKRKNGVEDIAKAKWYLEKYLELEEKKEGKSEGRAGQFAESIRRDWTGDYILRTEEGDVRLTPKEAEEWMKNRLRETENKLVQ